MNNKLLRIIWIRHATPINPYNICYGDDIEVDLSDTEALKLQALRLPMGAKWVTSPIRRAWETASALAAHHEDGPVIQMETAESLREQSFGDWVGLRRDALPAQRGFDALRADPVRVGPPGGECMADHAFRVGDWIDNTVRKFSNGGNIITVSHKGTIRAAIHHAMGVPLKDTLKIQIEPLSMTILAYDQATWTTEALNIAP